MIKAQVPCPLRMDNAQGIIFSSSIAPIRGTVNMEPENKLYSCEIRILDRDSNEIFRKALRSDNSDETSFVWDLKNSDSLVKSGCYSVSLIDSSQGIEICSTECKVADTRNIVAVTRSLKRHASPDSQALFSVYLGIMEDIQSTVLQRLEKNMFEEPYFVACITAGFIQEIADDMQNQSSRFRKRITEFLSRNSVPPQAKRLGTRALFDFLINYMAELEDNARAKAMANCGQCRLTQNDRAQIVSSLVEAIYPHCRTSIAETVTRGIIKLGIRYLCSKHINRSISISQTLPLGNPCDAVIR